MIELSALNRSSDRNGALRAHLLLGYHLIQVPSWPPPLIELLKLAQRALQVEKKTSSLTLIPPGWCSLGQHFDLLVAVFDIRNFTIF